MKRWSQKAGFILVELLVVTSIISVLSSIVITNVNKGREKAEQVAMGKMVDQYLFAIKSYQAENGRLPYPSDIPRSGNYRTTCLGDYSNNRCGIGETTNESAVLNNLLRPYFPSLPSGPTVQFDSVGGFFSGIVYRCYVGPGGANNHCDHQNTSIEWIVKGNTGNCFVSKSTVFSSSPVSQCYIFNVQNW